MDNGRYFLVLGYWTFLILEHWTPCSKFHTACRGLVMGTSSRICLI